jgi:hypothetical protein
VTWGGAGSYRRNWGEAGLVECVFGGVEPALTGALDWLWLLTDRTGRNTRGANVTLHRERQAG